MTEYGSDGDLDYVDVCPSCVPSNYTIGEPYVIVLTLSDDPSLVLNGVEVSVYNENRLVKTAITHSDGRVLLEGLIPTARYLIVVDEFSLEIGNATYQTYPQYFSFVPLTLDSPNHRAELTIYLRPVNVKFGGLNCP